MNSNGSKKNAFHTKFFIAKKNKAKKPCIFVHKLLTGVQQKQHDQNVVAISVTEITLDSQSGIAI